MATTTASAQLTDPPPPPTDDQLIAQLATLQSLHDKVFQLRSLLPERLIDPVKAAVEASRSGHEPPAALAAHLRSVAVEGDRDAKEFQERWRSEEMRCVWERAKEASFPQGRDIWGVNYVAMVGEQGRNSKEDDVEENVEEVLGRFKGENPKFKIEWGTETAGKLAIDLAVAGQSLTIIKGERLPEGEWIVTSNIKNPSKVANKEMLRSLRDRPNKRSLKFLLVSSKCIFLLMPFADDYRIWLLRTLT
jgi:hypothetical protein